jgi:DUF1680 family protein
MIERALYNGFLSGVSLDGARFFYQNPLASTGHHHRQGWFTCPCCPPNLARTLASIGGYFCSTGPKDIWVHLYGQNTAKMQLNGGAVSLRQITEYPWSGNIRFEVGVARPQQFTLHLRIPAWCERWTLVVNGKPAEQAASGELSTENGYIHWTREWDPGDIVELRMEMPIRVTWAHPAVRDLQGRVALERGPLVYCLEGVDHPEISLDRITIDPADVSSEFQVEYNEKLLGGINLLRGKGMIVDESGWENVLYRNQGPVSKHIDITAIPYFAWENRAVGEMRVWLRSQGG